MSTSLRGELPGFDARIVEQAVDQRVDDIFDSTFGLGSLSVSVDSRTAAASNGETGTAVLAGPRIGPRSLEEVLCSGIFEVVRVAESGKPLSLARRSPTVRRKLRRFVLDRDGGCTAQGCPSRYRLEAHHIVPWSQVGASTPTSW